MRNPLKRYLEKNAEKRHMKKHHELIQMKSYYDECVYKNPSTNGTGYGGMILRCHECGFTVKVVSVEINLDDYELDSNGQLTLKEGHMSIDLYTRIPIIPSIWRFEEK